MSRSEPILMLGDLSFPLAHHETAYLQIDVRQNLTITLRPYVEPVYRLGNRNEIDVGL